MTVYYGTVLKVADITIQAQQTGAGAAGGAIEGMAVFIHSKGGLMYEATVGGQTFSYTPNN